MKSNSQKNVEILKKLPKSEYYRLIVDGLLQNNSEEVGWLGYAMREPRSLPNALAALRFSLCNNFNDKMVSINLICEIHKCAMKGTQNTFATPGEFRETNYPGSFYLDINDHCSPTGLNELYQFVKDNETYGCCIGTTKKREYYLDSDAYENARKEMNNLINIGSIDAIMNFFQQPTSEDINKVLSYRAPFGCHIVAKLQEICDEYNKNILQSKDSTQQLEVIVKCVRQIEWLHPFHDGNCRVAYILLHRLLLQNGFLPAMLCDPNRFDGFSLEELIKDVQEGCKNTEDFCKNVEHTIFSCDTKIIDSRIQEIMSGKDEEPHIAPEMRFSTYVKREYKKVEKEITQLYEIIQNFNYENSNENRPLVTERSPLLLSAPKKGVQDLQDPPKKNRTCCLII